ncbi:MAG: thiol-disulfide oxidoreductase [Methylococcales bacterium]|jgi:hypothetical protein|nr:thiol-disulfide oxidoreductase [Methylococcales bacterium]
MRQFIAKLIKQNINTTVPATGLAIFRCLYGIIVFQEVIFLLFFRHLIFDPVPFIDNAYPIIPLFLIFWAFIGLCLIVGRYCQFASISNYLLWLVFLNFTPMRHEFGGGFDQFMLACGLLLIFLPINRGWSLDLLYYRLRNLTINFPKTQDVSILCYYLPIIFCLCFLYPDSAIHKLWAEHWLNGLGAWLPSSHPYYISAVDPSWLLNNELLQRCLGYLIIIFQLAFPFFIFRRHFQPLFLIVGVSFHLGITLFFNIYPFGLMMFFFYALVVPPHWWRLLKNKISYNSPLLTVFFQPSNPNQIRQIVLLQHFDFFKALQFKEDTNNKSPSIYTLNKHQPYSSHLSYATIFWHMRYTLPLSLLLFTPVLGPFVIKKQTNNTKPLKPNYALMSPPTVLYDVLHQQFLNYPIKFIYKFSKILCFLALLQLNTTINYAFLYRLNLHDNPTLTPLTNASNIVCVLSHTFLGITPHALYVHDHFEGYNRIFAIQYLGEDNNYHWLPFINEQGRILSPNWGRVHSMWANRAVTPHIKENNLNKALLKVTAFWGTKVGLSLNNAQFKILSKPIRSPSQWEYDLRSNNLNGPWKTIGSVNWINNRYQSNFPNLFTPNK